MNKSLKQVALLMLVGLLVMFLFFTNDQRKDPKAISYDKFLRLVKSKEIAQVTIVNEKQILGIYKNRPSNKRQAPGLGCGQQEKDFDFKLLIPYMDQQLIPTLTENEVLIDADKDEGNAFVNALTGLLPFLLIFGLIWFVMFRQIQSTGNKAISFGKSKAKLHPDSKQKVTFADVAGVNEAKDELNEVVDFLKEPKKFVNIGAKIPKGVLLMGPPGTGKTLLARAIAGEAGVPFYSISGSDFVEMFVGVGASRVRDLFEQGKKNAPCIVFIDEIDAVGRLRGAGLGGGHDEREQTLNQLLVEMDGFEANEGVIIIAATNRPDVLDPALLRPGRFDRRIIVDTPDIRGREKILAVHTKKLPLSREVDLKIIARGTPGFTGADLANLANEAALLTARRNKKRISMAELEEAKDKVLMGPERRSMLLTEDEKKKTAYHESGHALVGIMLDNFDPIHKATIIPRGRALGLVMPLPEKDQHNQWKSYLLSKIKVFVAGYLAEEMVFGDVSNGAQNDLENVSNIARRMVCEWGMSDELGLVNYGKDNEQIFLGREISQHRDYSEETAVKIDREVSRIVETCRNETKQILKDNYEIFERIATNLIERETLTGDELLKLKRGEELPPLENGNGSGEKKSSQSEPVE